MQPFKSFWQRVTLCLPKGRLLLCLPAQSPCSKQWVTYKPASQLAHCLIRQGQEAGVWGQAHRAVAVGLYPVRSPWALTLETWPSIAQFILVHRSSKYALSLADVLSGMHEDQEVTSQRTIAHLILLGLYLLYHVSCQVLHQEYELDREIVKRCPINPKCFGDS